MILNLTHSEKNSHITFKVINFSDSQKQIKLFFNNYSSIDNVEIYSRMSWDDLQIIIAATQALREHGIKLIDLYVPYFLGARSDRKFEEGTSNYLKTVICPIINSQNYNKVTVLDPHSDVLEACLNNFVKIDNVFLISHFFNLLGIDDSPVLISPDAGALKKIYNVAEKFNINDIVVASKHRDISTGKILGTEVPRDNFEGKNVFIIDDICDGGRTFIELAKKLKEKNSGKIYLIVTHGIFSAGIDVLKEHLDGIYTTNSVKDIQNDDFIKTFNIL